MDLGPSYHCFIVLTWIFLDVSARFGGAQLYCWWALLTYLFQCEFRSFKFMFSTLNCILDYASLSFLTNGIYSSCVSVGWSWWNCQLVSNTCWLVWEKMAPKVVQGSGYYLWTSKKYNGTILQLIYSFKMQAQCNMFTFLWMITLFTDVLLACIVFAVGWCECACY